PRRARQDFGYRAGRHGGGANTGEIGGWIQRSTTPAHYAQVIAPRTLRDHLSASGTFVVTRSQGGSGMLFGWFNQESRGWRTPNSLAFRVDGEKKTFRVFYEYVTQHWLTGGEGCFEGKHYQTTPTKPFLAGDARHTWVLEYDPA